MSEVGWRLLCIVSSLAGACLMWNLSNWGQPNAKPKAATVGVTEVHWLSPDVGG